MPWGWTATPATGGPSRRTGANSMVSRYSSRGRGGRGVPLAALPPLPLGRAPAPPQPLPAGRCPSSTGQGYDISAAWRQDSDCTGRLLYEEEGVSPTAPYAVLERRAGGRRLPSAGPAAPRLLRRVLPAGHGGERPCLSYRVPGEPETYKMESWFCYYGIGPPPAGRAGGRTAGTPGTVTTACWICCSSGASTRPPTAGTTPRSTAPMTAGTTGTDPLLPKAPETFPRPTSGPRLAGAASFFLRSGSSPSQDQKDGSAWDQAELQHGPLG